ncbi:MAG: hypothetical protein CMF98_03450 [Candidatus Marinimicrobia bacterium]|nr:hypothetical protein [Candidatus Neomarinimicrobiota bacterium]OUW50542.1 MAG: hypothetical protein CBD50_02045 [bacterium TMED190]|tara:strand:- start:3334 stop:3603 length:270 start_codon:yes stop_codon:yes gene_type:complete
MNDLNLLGKEGFQEKRSNSSSLDENINNEILSSDNDTLDNKYSKKNKIKNFIFILIIIIFLMFLINYLYHFFLIDVKILENNTIINEKY